MDESQEGKGVVRKEERSREYNSQDLRLSIRALRERWPVKDHMKLKVLNALTTVAERASSVPRDAVAAGTAIVLASKINLDAIKLCMKAQEQEQVIHKVDDYIEQHKPAKHAGTSAPGAYRTDHPG